MQATLDLNDILKKRACGSMEEWLGRWIVQVDFACTHLAKGLKAKALDKVCGCRGLYRPSR